MLCYPEKIKSNIKIIFMHIKERVDKIIEDHYITKAEQEELINAIDADGEIDPQEMEQIKRLQKLIYQNKVKVI